MQVTRSGRQLGVPEEGLNPARVGVGRDKRARTMAQRVELQLAQTGGRRGEFEAAAQRGAVERSAEPNAEHVVGRPGELGAPGEPGQRLRGGIGERDEAGLPALRRALDAVAEGALRDEPAVDDDRRLWTSNRLYLRAPHAPVLPSKPWVAGSSPAGGTQ